MPRTTDAPDKRTRATALANSRDTANRNDLHWLVSEAIAAWNKADALEAALAEAKPVVAAVAAYGAAIVAVDRAAAVRAGTYRDKESCTDADYGRACADHAAASETEQAALRELREALRALAARDGEGEGVGEWHDHDSPTMNSTT